MKTSALLIAMLACAVLSGCASTLTGLSNSDADFKCKAPQGVQCNSVSGIYANSVVGNYSGQAVSPKSISTNKANVTDNNSVTVTQSDNNEVNSPVGDIPRFSANKKTDAHTLLPYNDTNTNGISPADMNTPDSGPPLRTPPIVLRVWVAPWEDSDGDLHDQDYFYTVINHGQWVIEANRQRIQNEFKPLYPLKSKTDSTSSDNVSAADAGQSAADSVNASTAAMSESGSSGASK